MADAECDRCSGETDTKCLVEVTPATWLDPQKIFLSVRSASYRTRSASRWPLQTLPLGSIANTSPECNNTNVEPNQL